MISPPRHGLRYRARLTLYALPLILLSVLVLFPSASKAIIASKSPPALFKSSGSDNSKGSQFLQQVLNKPHQKGKPGRQAPSSAASSSFSSSGSGLSSEQICRPTGQIEDASCDYETVETINSQFFDRLDSLRKTDFFKYYKVNLFKECPFWNDNGLCMNRACSVETEDESDVPEEFRVNELSSVTTARPQDVVMTGSDSSCSCSSDEFCHLEDHQDAAEGVYVDLLKNPERFTGYAGTSANRVWKSIYEENCFNGVKFIEPARPQSSGGTGFIDKNTLLQSSNALGGGGKLAGRNPAASFGSLMSSLQAPLDSGDSEQCLEKRVFYRIISGLHASISIHICHDFLDKKTGEWAPNLECFITRIAEHPERLQNVYFDYVLLLRALSRLGDSSENFSLRDGDSIDDPATVAQLNNVIQDARSCPTTFDEAMMFSGQNRESLELKQEFRQHFRNISAIMDCVGCDKCRLWGKLQVNGVGTALKLLFNGNEEVVDGLGAKSKPKPVKLQRSELVSLVNAAHRIAESLRAVETFRDMYQATKLVGSEDSLAAAAASEDAHARSSVAASSSSPAQDPRVRESHHRAPPSRGTERVNQQQRTQRTAKNASSPPSTPQKAESQLERASGFSIQSILHWIKDHAEVALDTCRRSLGLCLQSLGIDISPFGSSSSSAHNEL